MGGQPMRLEPDSSTQLQTDKTKNTGSKNLNIGSWNIKRGLVNREIELRDILKKEEFDILFLNETDTKQISKKISKKGMKLLRRYILYMHYTHSHL